MKLVFFVGLLFLSPSVTANILKAQPQVCEKGMVCISEQSTCLTNRPARKRVKKPTAKLYSAPKSINQSVIPFIEEKPCEITQNHYYINETIQVTELARLPSNAPEGVWRNVYSGSNKFFQPQVLNGANYGFLFGVPVDVVRIVYVKEQYQAPVATPLLTAFWLFLSALIAFVLVARNRE